MHKRFKNEKAFSTWLAKELRKTYGKQIVVDVNTETGYGSNGRADFTICFCGAHISVELKQEGKELTALQEQYAEKVTDAGGWALAPMWPSKVPDLFDLLDLIADLARRNKRTAKKNYTDALEAMDDPESVEQAANEAAQIPEVSDEDQ